ncbi:PAS domain-containing protein [Clostridioides sp. ES-S-0010-02]|nr:PAS domain-containing protein [Clostridioides sp. ES-S-0010-02]
MLADNVLDVIFACDAINNKVIYINETACKLIGKDKESFIGQKCYQLFCYQYCNCDIVNILIKGLIFMRKLELLSHL